MRAADPQAKHVRDFCHDVAPGISPVLVVVSPRLGCQILECFHNVKNEINRVGGRIMFGWAIWEWPGIMIEAEHHSVLADNDSCTLIDVTPCQIDSPQRCFLQDNSATFDFNSAGIRLVNIRRPLIDDPDVMEFISSADCYDRFMNEIPGYGNMTLTGRQAQEFKNIISRMNYHEKRIREKQKMLEIS